MTRETIFAVASGSQRAGVAVIRVSGLQALHSYQILTKRASLTPRHATVAQFRDPETTKILDHGMAIYFAAPASFTGEDVVEYHLHGGVAVVQGFLNTLAKLDGCRMAEHGEFTRRAFENEKLDLTAAEAIADLVDAETEAQKMQALDQLGGGLEKIYNGWAAQLKKLLAHQEADIEFPDDDMPEGIAEQLRPEIETLLQDIRTHLNDGRRGERLRNGILIAIVGAPNAGKSSLLNALAGREAAIVSSTAGTTRDVIEVHLDLGGYPVILADTAGLRDAENSIEAEGIARARKIASDADLKLVLFDGTLPHDSETVQMVDDSSIVVLTKADKITVPQSNTLSISSTTGAGFEALLKTLTERVAAAFGSKSQPSLTRARHRLALEETVATLERSLHAPLPELGAEDLRLALRSLGKITGRVHVEDLLDSIFKDFCIGK
jgi:tRNA modification GTPase